MVPYIECCRFSIWMAAAPPHLMKYVFSNSFSKKIAIILRDYYTSEIRFSRVQMSENCIKLYMAKVDLFIKPSVHHRHLYITLSFSQTDGSTFVYLGILFCFKT